MAIRPYPYTDPHLWPTPPWAEGISIKEDGTVENYCKHGVGHPNYWQLLMLQQKHPESNIRGVHGCDGCCSFNRPLKEVIIT